jgi:3-oxoacyl-(acyl-carrier-protein) synthase
MQRQASWLPRSDERDARPAERTTRVDPALLRHMNAIAAAMERAGLEQQTIEYEGHDRFRVALIVARGRLGLGTISGHPGEIIRLLNLLAG